MSQEEEETCEKMSIDKRLHESSHSHFGIALALLVILTLAVHSKVLQGYWRVDDPLLLLYAVDHPQFWNYFISPATWKALGVPFFTPWLALDFRLNFAFFGNYPLFFYLHHLLVICLSAFLTYVLLQRYVAKFWSLAAAALFLTGAPVVVVSNQLMSRHYAMGLVFAIASILFFLNWREKHDKRFIVLALFCYLLALLNKEIYISLPLILFCVGASSFKNRFRSMFPFAFIAILFVCWRAAMLGKVIGGYGGGNNINNSLLPSLVDMPHVFWGEWGPVLCFVLFVLVLLIVVFSRMSFYCMAGGAIAVLLPFMAIRLPTHIFDWRLAFFPWWALCVLLAIICGDTFWRRRLLSTRLLHGIPFILFVFCAMASARHSYATIQKYSPIAKSYDVHGCFLWEYDDAVSYVPGGEVAGALQFQYAISALKARLAGGSVPRVVPTLSSAPWFVGSVPVYYYETEKHRMTQANPRPQLVGYWPDLPLDVLLDRRYGGLTWLLGAHSGATSCFLLFPHLHASFLVPCSGQIFYTMPSFIRGEVRVFITTDKNSWNISPPLQFPEKGTMLKWSSEPSEH